MCFVSVLRKFMGKVKSPLFPLPRPSPSEGRWERGLIIIEVTFGSSDQQILISLEVPATCTVEQAIIQSEILQKFPHMSLSQNKVGIFGQIVPLQHPLSPGDRIELYRPVKDPKQARREKVSG
jgi:uncharacterized protein